MDNNKSNNMTVMLYKSKNLTATESRAAKNFGNFRSLPWRGRSVFGCHDVGAPSLLLIVVSDRGE